MKHTLTLLTTALLALAPLAHAKESPEEHRQETVELHQKMAKAHSDAALCIAAIKPSKYSKNAKSEEKAESACHAELLKSCKGVGIGKYCGMKHGH